MRTPMPSDPFVSSARHKMRVLAESSAASATARKAATASSAGRDALASLASRFESAEVKEARRKRHEEETKRLFELERQRREADEAERLLREEAAARERLQREEEERQRLAEEAARLEREREEEEARLRAEQRMAARRQQMAEDELRLSELKPALAAFERAKMARKPAELRHEAKSALANGNPSACAVQETRDRLLRKMRADADARTFAKHLERLAHEDDVDRLVADCAMTREQSPEKHNAEGEGVKMSEGAVKKQLSAGKESEFERRKRSLMGLFNAKGHSLAAVTGKTGNKAKQPARKGALPSMFEQQEKRDAEFRKQKTEQKENIPVDKQSFARFLDKFEDVDTRNEGKTQLQRLTSDQKVKKATWAQRKEEEKRRILEEQELRRKREIEEENRRKAEEEDRIRKAQEDEDRRRREAEAAEAERVRLEEHERKKQERTRKKKELKLKTEAPKHLPKITSPACSQMRLRLQSEAEKRNACKAQKSVAVGKLDISSFGSVRQLLEGPSASSPSSPPATSTSTPIVPPAKQKQIPVLKENPVTDIKRRFSRRAGPDDGESGAAAAARPEKPAKPSPTDSKTRAQEKQVQQQKAEAEEAEAISSASVLATSGAASACPASDGGDDDADGDGQAAVTAPERAADLTSQQHEENEDTHKEQGANQVKKSACEPNKEKDTKAAPTVKRQKSTGTKKDKTMASKTSMQNYLISHLLFDEDTSKTRNKKQSAAPSLRLKTNEVGDIKSRFERQLGQSGGLVRANVASVPAQDPATFDEKVNRVKVLFGEKEPEPSLVSGMPVRSKVALNRDLLGKFDSPEMAAQLKAAKEREARERQRMVERAEERKKKESEAVQRLREQREQEEYMEKLKRERQIKREMDDEDERAMFEEVEAALEEAMTAGKANDILREMEDLMDDAAESIESLKPSQVQAQTRPSKVAPKQKTESKPSSLKAGSSDIRLRGDALKKKFESSLLGDTSSERQATRPKPSPSIKSMGQDLFRSEAEVKKDFQDTRSLGGVGEVLNKTKQRFETSRVPAEPPKPQPKKEWSWKKKELSQPALAKPKEADVDATKKKEVSGAEAMYLTEKWRRKKKHIEDLQTFLSRNKSMIPDDAGVHKWVDSLSRSNTDHLNYLVAKQTEEQKLFLDDVNAFLDSRDKDSGSNAFKETVRVYMDLIENEEKGRISEAKKLNELKTEKVSNMKKAMMEHHQKQQQLSTRKKSPTLERKSRLDSIMATASKSREQAESKARPILKKQAAMDADRSATSGSKLQSNIQKYESRSKPRPHSSYHYPSAVSDDEDDIPLHVLKDEQLYEMYKERFYSSDSDGDEEVDQRAPETPARQDSYTALRNIMGLMRQKQAGQAFKAVQQTFDGNQPAEEPRQKVKPVKKTGGDTKAIKSAKSVFEKAASVTKPEPPPRKTVPRSLSYNTAAIKSNVEEAPIPWRQKSFDSSGAVAQARKSWVVSQESESAKPRFKIPDDERSSESREALRRKFENRSQNSSLSQRRLSSDMSDLPYSVGKSSSFSKFRDSFETGSITDLRKENQEQRRTMPSLSRSSSFDVFKKAFEANRGSEIRHEDETEEEYSERMLRQSGSREHLYPLSRNSSFDMFRKAFESNKANCLRHDSDSDDSSYDGRRRLSRPDIPISRSSSFDIFRKAFDQNKGNCLVHDDEDNVSLVDDDDHRFRPGGLALSKSASMVRFQEDMKEQYGAARGGKMNALRRNNSFTKFKKAFEANTGGLRGDDSDSDFDDFDDDDDADDVDGRSGRGSNYDLRRNDSFSKFREAFENSKVSQMREAEDMLESEDERPYSLSRSNSRAELQAELQEIRSSSRLKKLMHTLKPSKTSSAVGNPYADSSFAAAASSTADDYERNAPSLLKKSFTTTSVSFDKETCREISKSREAIKSFMDSSASKVSFGSGVKRAPGADNARSAQGVNPKKPKESKATKLAEARAKKFPQFADRKWVFDTINKYFDVIEENVEEEKEEEEDESFDATPSPSPSPIVAQSPWSAASSFKVSGAAMQSQSLLKPPSASPLSSPRLSPSSSSAQVISSFASTQPSAEVKSMLSEIMNENSHLNLDMFKKNLSAQLTAFSSRK